MDNTKHMMHVHTVEQNKSIHQYTDTCTHSSYQSNQYIRNCTLHTHTHLHYAHMHMHSTHMHMHSTHTYTCTAHTHTHAQHTHIHMHSAHTYTCTVHTHMVELLLFRGQLYENTFFNYMRTRTYYYEENTYILDQRCSLIELNPIYTGQTTTLPSRAIRGEATTVPQQSTGASKDPPRKCILFLFFSSSFRVRECVRVCVCVCAFSPPLRARSLFPPRPPPPPSLSLSLCLRHGRNNWGIHT